MNTIRQISIYVKDIDSDSRTIIAIVTMGMRRIGVKTKSPNEEVMIARVITATGTGGGDAEAHKDDGHL